MTGLEKLAQFLKRDHPDATVEIEHHRSGNVVMDVRRGSIFLVVLWRPGAGFKLWKRGPGDQEGWADFWQRADERLPTVATAQRRLSHLLTTVPQRQPA
jgi:hypothetical protein